MDIVDAQIHLWGSGLPSNQAHRQVTSFTPEEAIKLMDEGGVNAAVIHPPSWDANSITMAQKAVIDYPGRFAIMGSIPMDDSSSAHLLKTWRDQPGMLGLRFTFLKNPAQKWLHDGTLNWLWEAADESGIPIAFLATDSFEYLGEIAKNHPNLKLTIDHLGGRGGNTVLKDSESMQHIPDLLKLSRFPNIAIKATGIPGYSSESFPFPSMHSYLKQVYDAFGPERMFWGTDITKMKNSWKECIEMFTQELNWLTEQDKKLIMGESICKWWGWTRGV
jgi:predicted TIM-barrel fold metal-dependent hydrolase